MPPTKRCSSSASACPCTSLKAIAKNIKITTPEDLQRRAVGSRRLQPSPSTRSESATVTICTGSSPGRPLILAGVTIPFELGLDGHSDADIVCHAVTDAILGAAGAGDIGRMFPDTDPKWKGAEQYRAAEGRGRDSVHDAGYACRTST